MNSRGLPFDNPTSQSERTRILEDERRTNTRSAYTGVTDPVAGGRFAKALGEYTVGSAPTVEYPKLPDGSPWRQQQPPNEEPFGIDIQYVEPCGTDAEVERAAAIAASAATDNLLGGSCADAAFPLGQQLAGVSPPLADDADPSGFTEGLAMGPSPVSEVTSPLSSDSRATDPTSSLGSDPSSSSPGDQQLAQPSTPDAPKVAVSVRREGAGSFRRFG
jgi:hypothetical protein